MARKKEIKPLFSLKHDFYDSLDHLLQQNIMLVQSVEQAISHGAIEGPIKEILQERVEAVRKAMMSDE